jgi:hypothetical protein
MVNAASTWTQTSAEDFENGTRENLTITSTGSVKLINQTNYARDNFYNDSKIAFKSNVDVIIPGYEVRLDLLDKTFGGTKDDSAGRIHQTLDGGYIFAGNSRSYSAGNPDAWIFKTDSKYVEQWSKTFGGSNPDYAYSAAKTSDGGTILIGKTSSYSWGTCDAWLIKTNSTGDEQWNKSFGGNIEDVGYGGQQTSDGGYIFTGYTDSYGAGNYDLWLVKTDSIGEELWNRTFGGSSVDMGASVQQTSDGGYFIIGYTYSFGEGNYDAWLIKTDSNGAEQWSKTYGGASLDIISSILKTPDGGYLLIGHTMSYGAGLTDLWLIKTNSTYVEQWNKTIGTNMADAGTSGLQTADGGYIFCGYTRSYGMGSDDVWLIKTNSTFVEQWNKTYGGSQTDMGGGINITADGGYLIQASTRSFGAGNGDVWLFETDINGTFTGNFTSKNMLEGKNSNSILSVAYQTTIYANTNIKVQFSQDNINWYNSNGVLNEWDTLSNGYNDINLSTLNWRGSKFYYKAIFSTIKMSNNLPKMRYFNLKFTQYLPSGSLISQPFSKNTNITLKSIAWNSTEPVDTEIKFQLRTARTQAELSSNDFVGPDGTSNSIYTVSGSSIWAGHKNDSWVQYIAYLNTSNTQFSPLLKDVTICYNIIPFKPTLTKPANNELTNDNKPTFNWTFNDQDGNQDGFQWQADDYSDFNNIDYDSDEVTSNVFSYTPSNPIPDGTWYWRVRTKDSDGDWGSFSDPWKIKIDTNASSSSINYPLNNGYYYSINSISGIAMDPNNGAGVNKVELAIKDLDKDLFWDGITWSSTETWVLTSGTLDWSFDSSLVEWTSSTQYQVQSRAIDNALNIEIPSNSTIFNIDQEKPASTIEYSINNMYFNNLDSILGNAIDPGNSGIAKVEICIQRKNNDEFWSGNNWEPGETWLLTSGGNEWSYDTSLINWETGVQYLVRSRGTDNTSNVEAVGEGVIFTYDPDAIIFSNFIPSAEYVSPTEEVEVGITITDLISGVNASTIEYIISMDNGKTWSPWQSILGYQDGKIVNVRLNLTFPNGTSNVIKWRASDLAGNGPTQSRSYFVIVNTLVQSLLPKVILQYPMDQSKVPTTMVELKWQLENENMQGITYDIIFDTNYPPVEVKKYDHDTTSLMVDGLVDGKTYYWSVKPKLGTDEGICLSQVWSFTIDISYIPTYDLTIELDRSMIELKPGENTTIKATVTNLGDLQDTISLSLQETSNPGVTAEITNPTSIELNPGNNAEFIIEIKVGHGTAKGDVVFTIEAISENSPQDSKVKRDAVFTVKVLEVKGPEVTEDDSDKKGDNSFMVFSIIIAVIIVIVILLSILVMRKKKKEQSGTHDSPELVVPPAETPSPPVEQQAPSTTPAPSLTTQDATQSTMTTTEEGTVLVPKTSQLGAAQDVQGINTQLPDIKPIPQLPPAQQQTSEPTPEIQPPVDTPESETSTTQPSPEIQQPPQPPIQQTAPVPQQQPQPQTQPRTTLCPLCQKEIQEYVNPCPHCGGELQWG